MCIINSSSSLVFGNCFIGGNVALRSRYRLSGGRYVGVWLFLGFQEVVKFLGFYSVGSRHQLVIKFYNGKVKDKTPNVTSRDALGSLNSVGFTLQGVVTISDLLLLVSRIIRGSLHLGGWSVLRISPFGRLLRLGVVAL